MTYQMPYNEISWWENQLTDTERAELIGDYVWHGEMEERHTKLHEMYLKWLEKKEKALNLTWKAGDKIMYHECREATLIKPMTPYGVRNAETKVEGQVWELKFDNLPCTVYRWLYPALDKCVQSNPKEKA